jgi:hypothetical protein
MVAICNTNKKLLNGHDLLLYDCQLLIASVQLNATVGVYLIRDSNVNVLI